MYTKSANKMCFAVIKIPLTTPKTNKKQEDHHGPKSLTSDHLQSVITKKVICLEVFALIFILHKL